MTASTTSANCFETSTALAELPCASCDSGPAMPAGSPNCRDFRTTLGNFATGITVITALSPEGEPIGVTISSFNSVSLDPPLILWSLSLNSPNIEAFSRASHYAVNVLAADQQHISDVFAARKSDRFAGLAFTRGLSDVPLLDGCCAWFECTNEAHYPGGDHLIFVGRVERFAQGQAESPLIFHNGRYCGLHVTKF